MNKLLVVGTGRSGTTYLNTLMRALGLNVRIEGITPNRNGFQHQVEIAHGAVGRIPQLPKDYCVAHQVRHPLKVIRRFLFTFFQNPSFVDSPIIFYNQTFPEHPLPAPPPISRNIEIVCEYYCRWNKLAESNMAKLPSERIHKYKVENIDTEIFNLYRLMDLEINEPFIKRVMANIGKNVHTRHDDIPMESAKRPWIEGNGLFEHIGFDDVTPELQDYILELGYEKTT
jgi:hypothetical protein